MCDFTDAVGCGPGVVDSALGVVECCFNVVVGILSVIE